MSEPTENTPQAPEPKQQPVQTQASAASKMTGTQKMLLGFGSVVVVCATVVAVMFLMKPDTVVVEAPPEEVGRVINAENVEAIQRDVSEKVDRGMFQTHMNTTWKFPNGSSPSSNAVMGNSAANNYDFYFTLTLSETGEQVFESGLIPVGSEIAEITLSRDLDAGTYPASVKINMVDEEGKPVDSNIGINVTIEVQG